MRRIRSVSHLDLARVGAMTRRLHKLSNRKERTGRLLLELPPARFCWSTLPLPRALALASACVHPRCAHPTSGGTRKLSVPGRVHSVPESCGSQAALRLPRSNPFVTRDTVESPAKRL